MRVLLAGLMFLLLLTTAGVASSCQGKADACGGKEQISSPETSSELDKILANLRKQNSLIETYQARIEYIYIEDPDWAPTKTTRKGDIYYKKANKRSTLLIRFESMRLDDEEPEKRKVEYLFDGVWLKIVDHQNETVNSYQKSKKDKPVDAFELISRDFPLIGFTGKDDLRKNFEISLSGEEENSGKTAVKLILKPKKGSNYAKNYSNIDFYIDKRTFLPVRMITCSTEGDIYDIALLYAKINKKLKDAVFRLETPSHFIENVQKLKK